MWRTDLDSKVETLSSESFTGGLIGVRERDGTGEHEGMRECKVMREYEGMRDHEGARAMFRIPTASQSKSSN